MHITASGKVSLTIVPNATITTLLRMVELYLLTETLHIFVI